VSGEALVFLEDPSQLRKTLSNKDCVESALISAPLSLTRGEEPLGILTCSLLVDIRTFVSASLIVNQKIEKN